MIDNRFWKPKSNVNKEEMGFDFRYQKYLTCTALNLKSDESIGKLVLRQENILVKIEMFSPGYIVSFRPSGDNVFKAKQKQCFSLKAGLLALGELQEIARILNNVGLRSSRPAQTTIWGAILKHNIK